MSSVVNNLFQYQKKTQNTLNNMKNGRVDITGKYENGMSMPLYSERNPGIDGNNTNHLAYMFESTDVQKEFFSKRNIDHLQKLMKHHVWLKSNKQHVIGNQDYNQLAIIMKSIYLQYGQNNSELLSKQIKRLNAFVLDYTVSNILLNIKQHVVYKKNVSTLPKPMDRPIYISSAGTRTKPKKF